MLWRVITKKDGKLGKPSKPVKRKEAVQRAMNRVSNHGGCPCSISPPGKPYGRERDAQGTRKRLHEITHNAKPGDSIRVRSKDRQAVVFLLAEEDVSLNITPRSGWTSYRPSLTSMATPRANVFIHHTADAGPPGGAKATPAQEKGYMRSIESFHRNSRGWRAIAYSFVVMPSGGVYEGRGWGKVGGHTLNHNSTSHAACFAGNFQMQKPTEASLSAGKALLAHGIAIGAITKSPNIRGHRDVGSTACPGNHLYARMKEMNP